MTHDQRSELMFEAQRAILLGSMLLTKAAILGVNGESQEFYDDYADRIVDQIETHFISVNEIAREELRDIAHEDGTVDLYKEILLDPVYVLEDLEMTDEEQKIITFINLGIEGTVDFIIANGSLDTYYEMYYQVFLNIDTSK